QAEDGIRDYKVTGVQRVLFRSIAGSTRFENGKIHDVLFLGMPKLEHGTTLMRPSLSLGTKETFFYLSMLLNVGEKIDTLNQVAEIGRASCRERVEVEVGGGSDK